MSSTINFSSIINFSANCQLPHPLSVQISAANSGNRSYLVSRRGFYIFICSRWHSVLSRCTGDSVKMLWRNHIYLGFCTYTYV
uniref:Uncharacterized protein n=1 Tax=Kalanchoe fedtschenkoi TaxID=63787 RepID=A0A7N0UYJ7_KALFE